MFITNRTTILEERFFEDKEEWKGGKLNLKKFNALPTPVTAQMMDGDEYFIDSACVQLGVSVWVFCGQIDLYKVIMVKTLIDWNGQKHNPDDFWLD